MDCHPIQGGEGILLVTSYTLALQTTLPNTVLILNEIKVNDPQLNLSANAL